MSSRTVTLRVSSPNGRYSASLCGPRVALWEGFDREPTLVIESGSVSTLTTATWTADSNSLILGFSNGMVQVWDVERATMQVCFEQPRTPTQVTCIAHSPRHETIAVLDQENRIRILNIENGTALAEFGSPFATQSLAWSPDGQLLYTDLMPIWSLVDRRVFSALAVVEPHYTSRAA